MSRSCFRTFLGVAVVAITVSTNIALAADPAPDEATMKLGQRTYMLCQSCHTLEQGGPHRIGPNLWGFFGTKSGTHRSDFKYSDAVKKAGITWDDKTLDAWIANPAKFIQGNRMAFRGVDKEENRKALIVFLKQKTGAVK